MTKDRQLVVMKKIRGSWGDVKPYTRVEENKKKYNRKEKHKKDYSSEA